MEEITANMFILQRVWDKKQDNLWDRKWKGFVECGIVILSKMCANNTLVSLMVSFVSRNTPREWVHLLNILDK